MDSYSFITGGLAGATFAYLTVWIGLAMYRAGQKNPKEK